MATVSAFSVYQAEKRKRQKSNETHLKNDEIKGGKIIQKQKQLKAYFPPQSIQKENKKRNKLKPLKKNKVITLESLTDNCHNTFDKETSQKKKLVEEATLITEWLLSPINLQSFFDHHWEKNPFHIQRHNNAYYSEIFNSKMLNEMLKSNSLHYTRNVDVVVYENGKKMNYNQIGRAVASAIWDYYNNGCSIRILNPQTYCPSVHKLLADLQEFFGAMVGSNVYLTPPGSQGFAPHFDDIEAFVIQLEGRKHWKLYKPKNSDYLARESSKNFQRNEIGTAFMEVTLEAGDLLYFPRGTIHEAHTDDESHSLHITLSVYQHTSYIDLLEQLLPEALKKASDNNVEYRKGLPVGYLKNIGATNFNNTTEQREEIISTVRGLFEKLIHHLDVDKAADVLGRKFMYDCMPPVLSNDEKLQTSHDDGDNLINGTISKSIQFDLNTKVRLVRYYSCRLSIEENGPKLYYCTENAKQYHGEDEQFLEFDDSLVPMFVHLQRCYPSTIKIHELPLDDEEVKLQFIYDLWEHDLIMAYN